MIELLNLDVLNNIIDSRILMNSPQNKEDELTAWWDIEDLKRECKKGINGVLICLIIHHLKMN